MPVVQPTEDTIVRVAAMLASGGLVVIPTETVYGLACDALDPEAVAKVFAAKGRPAENPLIVHVQGVDDLERVATGWDTRAERLAVAFWPGPLTLVLTRHPSVPNVTTAGLGTVAVRAPSHFVARRVIAAAGRPLAAPSANRFGELSPTTAEDAFAAIGGCVVDGGACLIGLESTVVDLTGPTPVILRPGAVTRASLESELGESVGSASHVLERRSPGLYDRHYAPRAPLVIVDRLGGGEYGLTFGKPSHVGQIQVPASPEAYGALLYAALRRLDAQDPPHIAVERPPTTPEWEAVHDRLARAAVP